MTSRLLPNSAIARRVWSAAENFWPRSLTLPSPDPLGRHLTGSRRYLAGRRCDPCGESSLASEAFPEALGFKNGDTSVHTARTMMLAELGEIFSAVPAEGSREDYWRAAIEDNVLGKPSMVTRRSTVKHLAELYGLTPAEPLFRNLRRLWPQAGLGRPMLALLCACARDPLLRLTAPNALKAKEGATIPRAQVEEVIATGAPGRFSPKTIRSVAQATSSTWTQSGHFTGRAKKVRSRPRVTREAVAYALFLGHLCGLRGPALFTSFWASLLDRRPEEVLTLAEEASAAGLLTLKQAGPVVEVGFPGWLTPEEEALLR